MPPKRKPSCSPAKKHRSPVPLTCDPSPQALRHNRHKKRCSVESPKSGSDKSSASDEECFSDKSLSEQEWRGGHQQDCSAPQRFPLLTQAGFKTPSPPADNDQDLADCDEPGRMDCLPQLAGQPTRQSLPENETPAVTSQKSQSSGTGSSEDDLPLHRSRQGRRHRVGPLDSSDEDPVTSAPGQAGTRQSASRRALANVLRFPCLSDPDDSSDQDDSGNAKEVRASARSAQKKRQTTSSSSEQSSSDHAPSEDQEERGPQRPTMGRPTPSPQQSASGAQPAPATRHSPDDCMGRRSSASDSEDSPAQIFSAADPPVSPLPSMQFSFINPNRNGVGMSFPAWSASDEDPAPCSISSDPDWLFLLGENADFILARFQPPLKDFELTLHSPLFRVRNNDSSRLAAVSNSPHFKPRTFCSSQPARHPLPLTGFPNLVVGNLQSPDGHVFTISVYLLVSELRKTNYMLNEEMAVLCAAMNAAKMFHSALLPDIGCRSLTLDKAANAMPLFTVGKKGDRRKETCMDADTGQCFFVAVRKALMKLAHNPLYFRNRGLVAKVDGTPVEPGIVQQHAVMFLEKCVWEASCAGCLTQDGLFDC